MDNTKVAEEDVRHVEEVAPKTQIIRRKIDQMKPNAETTRKTNWHFQHLQEYTEETGESLRGNLKTNVTFLEVRKTVESFMKENKYISVVRRTSPINHNKQPKETLCKAEITGTKAIGSSSKNSWGKYIQLKSNHGDPQQTFI